MATNRLSSADGDADDERQALINHDINVVNDSNRSSCLKGLGIIGLILGTIVFIVIISIVFKDKHQHKADPVSISPSAPDLPLMNFESNAVISSSSVCNMIGSFVLNDLGGNAMDAAVATILCSGGSNFQSNGVGGGSMMLYYNSTTKSFTSFNFRSVAPLASKPDMFKSYAQARCGGLSIAVPGEIAGLYRAHSLYGRLPWKQVVIPTVQLLRNGQKVSGLLARDIRIKIEIVKANPKFHELLKWMHNPKTGELYNEGDWLVDEKLANTMEILADDPMSFYHGELGKQIVQEIQDGDGIIEEADLLNFSVQELNSTELLSADLHNLNARLHFLPPPSGAIIIAFVLRILDGYQWKQNSGVTDFPLFLHRFVESLKFGFAQWSGSGDPNFVNMTELVHNLTDDGFIDEIRRKITDDRTHNVSYYDPKFHSNQDAGTTHVSVVDKDGNAVAVTSTINIYFGSFIRGVKTGIFYNNAMSTFSIPNATDAATEAFPPCPRNFIAPGKQPTSSISPLMVTDFDNNLLMVTGTPGGYQIISSVAYVIARYFLFGENLKEAVDAVRLHHQLFPNRIMYGSLFPTLPQWIVRSLEQRGHILIGRNHSSGIAAIVKVKDKIHGHLLQSVGDYRRFSQPAGI